MTNVKAPFSITYERDAIRILKADGDEVVMWHQDEWIEDPNVVFSIVNAACCAVSEPGRLLDLLEAGA